MNHPADTPGLGEDRFELVNFNSDYYQATDPETTENTLNTSEAHDSIYDALVSARSNSASPSSLQREQQKRPVFARVNSFLSRPFHFTRLWKRQSRFHGWQWGVVVGACTGTLVLLMNCAFAIVGAATGSGYRGGVATLFTGSTSGISQASTVSHIIINVLSILLLSASNYAMQVLSAPTRDECENAHRRGHWLDIGILSMRNIGFIAMRRRILWFAFALSSIPLHLFYNASVFQVKTGNTYHVDVIRYGSPDWKSLNNIFNSQGSNNTEVLRHLTVSELQAAYEQDYISEYGDVTLVVSNVHLEYDVATFHDHQNQTITLPVLEMPLDAPVEISGPLNSSTWILHVDDNGFISASALNIYQNISWDEFISIGGATVRLTLASGFARVGARNTYMQSSLPFLLVVIVCNAIKVGCLVCMLMLDLGDAGSPMVTIGDAVIAFLENQDMSTCGYGSYSKADYFWKSGRTKRTVRQEENGRAARLDRRCEGIWEQRTDRYGAAISKRKREFLYFMQTDNGFGLPFVLGIIFAIGAIPLESWGTASPTRFSFGQQKFDGATTSRLALIANSPQLFLSMIYLFFNNMFTSMASAYEWNQFGTHRKGLCVTKPVGEQRETYFLQLPLKWAVPLNALSGLLHWLASQTLFVVRLDRFDRNGQLQTELSEAACGFSSSALLASSLVLLIITAIVAGLGFIPFEAQVPFAGSCSWVISAACHPNPDEVDSALGKVKWGVILEADESEGVIGKCSFSHKSVKKPVVGNVYK